MHKSFLFGENGGANPPNQERRQSIKAPQNKTRSCCGKALCAVRCGHESTKKARTQRKLARKHIRYCENAIDGTKMLLYNDYGSKEQNQSRYLK
jgi:hypothetical protein